MVGQSAQAKSSLEDQKTYRDLLRQERAGQQRLDQIGAQGENAQALARVKADIEAGRQPSPRDLALIPERGKIQENLFDRAEAGRNYRAEKFGVGGRGGRPQLRLVSDGQGYNFGDTDAAVRPYVLGGLGATQYGSLDTATVGEIGGETQFSSTWALGLKMFPSPKFGLRLETRWTPTYIKTDPEGYWCDPYWGCYTVGESEFSNQFELSGGIIIRF